MQIVFLFALIGGVWVVWRLFQRRQRRKALLAAPLTERQRDIIDEFVPILQKVPIKYRDAMEGKINLFLDQVEFIGCDGLDVTEEMRVSVAAQACLLVANTDRWYDSLRTILMYPGAYKAIRRSHADYVVTEEDSVRLGESWARGPVVLSWAHTEQGAVNELDGKNLVFHEFAHQFDNLSGHTDGAPLMSKGQSFAEWERVILEAFDEHVRNVEQGRKTVLDAYGATAHEEFFAVAVEAFFEKPVQLKQEEPEVFQQLVMLFQLDPSEW